MTTDQPMTDAELAHARRRQSDPLAHPSPTETRLLAEVDRLRTENETLSTEAGAQLREAAARTVRAQNERDAARSRIEAALLIADSLRHAYENGDASWSLDYINGAEAIAAMLKRAPVAATERPSGSDAGTGEGADGREAHARPEGSVDER